MTTIRLGTFFPNRLNLNGDQGNLLALKRMLEAAEFRVEVVPITSTEQAAESHFLLLGHGSGAAMASIESQLAQVDWNHVTSTTPGIAVGSGTEWLCQRFRGAQAFTRGERNSEFRVAKIGNLEVLGYRNSDTTLPDLQVEGQFMLTMLHGPLLAKNPKLLVRSAKAAVKRAGGDWPEVLPTAAVEWLGQLNRISRKIWELEAEADFPAAEL